MNTPTPEQQQAFHDAEREVFDPALRLLAAVAIVAAAAACSALWPWGFGLAL